MKLPANKLKQLFTILLLTILSHSIVLAQNAADLDNSFNPGTGANGLIRTTSIQSDGKIIIGGYFTSFNGTGRNYIARLNANGSLDTGFDPGSGANNHIYATPIQSDGKIIIGGQFTSYNGTARNRIARLNADGSLDTGFNPGTGADGSIYLTSIQSDGKIIIGGSFYSYNGTTRNRIARLNTDGSLDTGFDPGFGANLAIWTTSIQSDGKIIIGGNFTIYNSTGRNYIARLNADGSLDTGFNPGTGANDIIYSTSIQSDGKIIIGGWFTSYNGTVRNRIARLNADGSLDAEFDPGTGANYIYATSIQSNGKIIVGGEFPTFNGTPRNRIARLNADGSLDTEFDPGTGTNGTVETISLQSDGKIIIGGGFATYNGTGRNSIARLNGNIPTGISNKYNTTGIKIYPNPSIGIITAETSKASSNAELKIISLVGIVQKSFRLNNTKENQITLEEINQGMYVYELWQDGERKAGGMLQVR